MVAPDGPVAAARNPGYRSPVRRLPTTSLIFATLALLACNKPTEEAGDYAAGECTDSA